MISGEGDVEVGDPQQLFLLLKSPKIIKGLGSSFSREIKSSVGKSTPGGRYRLQKVIFLSLYQTLVAIASKFVCSGSGEDGNTLFTYSATPPPSEFLFLLYKLYFLILYDIFGGNFVS